MRIFTSRVAQCVTVALCGLLCFGCSGGGGGGDGGSEGRPTTGFRVVHAAIDTSPVDISSSLVTERILGTSTYARSAPYVSSSTGALTVTLSRATRLSDVLFSESLSLERGDAYSLFLFGDRTELGEDILAVKDSLPAVTGDNTVAIRIFHGAVGAAAIAASVGGALITDGLAYGQITEYTQAPAGEVAIRARRVVDGELILTTNQTLESGKAYTFVVSGIVGTIVFGELLSDS